MRNIHKRQLLRPQRPSITMIVWMMMMMMILIIVLTVIIPSQTFVNAASTTLSSSSPTHTNNMFTGTATTEDCTDPSHINQNNNANGSIASSTESILEQEKQQQQQEEAITNISRTEKTKKRLNIETMSQSLRYMDYAVRGKIVTIADKISDEIRDSMKVSTTTTTIEQNDNMNDTKQRYPFDHIVYTNIGNPHSLGQKPLTWSRQVMALVDLPDHVGVYHPNIHTIFPSSAIRRAIEIKQGLGIESGTGAYTHSKGVYSIRCDVANFIQQRDGNVVPSDPESIFLTNGASSGIHMILQALISNNRNIKTGVMIPIPQYPIYSATVDLLEGVKVGYYLNEETQWGLDVDELERAYQEAINDGITVNSFVLINPGNPTGQVLSKQNVQDVIRFCVKHQLVLLADEVYQENVYDGEFYSCKRAAYDCNLLDEIELVSFHSVSKGVFGECGRRGGYMELTGIDPDVTDELYKLASSSLCATVSGQIMVSLMVRGPDTSEPEYALHEAEKRAIYESLKRRSQIVTDGLNAISGFTCQPSAGAMYAFPSIIIPPKAITYANEIHETPDSVYCLSLLQSTGICVVPASGFGQKPGRYGFRTTILPNEQELQHCMQLIADHYQQFIKEYE